MVWRFGSRKRTHEETTDSPESEENANVEQAGNTDEEEFVSAYPVHPPAIPRPTQVTIDLDDFSDVKGPCLPVFEPICSECNNDILWRMQIPLRRLAKHHPTMSLKERIDAVRLRFLDDRPCELVTPMDPEWSPELPMAIHPKMDCCRGSIMAPQLLLHHKEGAFRDKYETVDGMTWRKKYFEGEEHLHIQKGALGSAVNTWSLDGAEGPTLVRRYYCE